MFDLHFVEDDSFFEEMISSLHVPFHEEFFIKVGAKTHLRVAAKLFELCDKFRVYLMSRGLPFDMSLALNAVPLTIERTEQQLVFITDAVEHGFGSCL